jgi:IclR family transcriptional regulator, acetate operon repressor
MDFQTPAGSVMTGAQGKKGSGLLRGLAVIEAVSASSEPPRHSDLMSRLGLPKATVYRLCRQLVDEGMLQYELDGGRLLPGPRLMKVARGALAASGDLDLRHAILQALSAEIGETCNLVIPAGTEMTYIDRVEVDSPLGIRFAIGSRNPMHCVPSGKLFLSSLDARRRRRLIRHLPLDRYTPGTITDPTALEAESERVRSAGFGTEVEEFVAGMVGIGVRIPLADKRLFAAIGMHAPVSRLGLDAAIEHVPAMRRAAAELAELFEEGDVAA